MSIRRYVTKSRAGHWTLTLVDQETGARAYSDKHDTRHGALAEEDDLMELLKARSAPAAPVITLEAACAVAQDVAREAGAADAGVVLSVVTGNNDIRYCLWRINIKGRISDHYLDAASTDRARLLAHARGFIENHRREFA